MTWSRRPILRLRRILWQVLFALAGLYLVLAGSPPPETTRVVLSPELQGLVTGNTAFGLELFSGMEEGNLILSPLTISSAFALLYGGAHGSTEMQLGQVLHFPSNQLAFHSGMEAVLTAITDVPAGCKLELSLANSLWPQTGYPINTGFTDRCRQHYRAEVNPADFAADPGGVCRRMNSWVAEHTRQKIRKLFTPGEIASGNRLAVVNAIYFKGKWVNRFPSGKTRTEPFWSSPREPVQVPLMHQKARFPYFAEGDIQALEMPYQGETLSMVVLLPKDRDGLRQLEERLTSENLGLWMEKLKPTSVEVVLPRFRMKSSFSLMNRLLAMGLKDPFDATRADFTGISPRRPLFIGNVNHAAFIEVDEEGAGAGAATGIGLGCAKEAPPVSFQADHPFVFLIRERRTGTVLFIGRVANPRE